MTEADLISNTKTYDTRSSRSSRMKEKLIAYKSKSISSDILNKEPVLLTKKEIGEYKKINKFFKEQPLETIQKMVDIINKNKESSEIANKISLRLMDFTATHYSKKGLKIPIKKKGDDSSVDDDNHFRVNISYEAQLKSYTKNYFDPFRRKTKGAKFYWWYDKKNPNKYLETTICQLNFFRWAIENPLLEYIEENYKMLSKKMSEFCVNSRKKKKIKEDEKKKQEKVSKNTSVSKNGCQLKASKIVKEDNNVSMLLSFT